MVKIRGVIIFHNFSGIIGLEIVLTYYVIIHCTFGLGKLEVFLFSVKVEEYSFNMTFSSFMKGLLLIRSP